MKYIIKEKELINKEFGSFIFEEFIKSGKDGIGIACIGTDAVLNDSFGPLLGSMMVDRGLDEKFKIFGTLNDTINGVNATDRIKDIQTNHSNLFIVAVDASIAKSDKSERFSVELTDDPIRPGYGVGKNLPSIGDLSIKFIVSRNLDEFHYHTMRLRYVYNACLKVCSVFEDLIPSIEKHQIELGKKQLANMFENKINIMKEKNMI